MRPSVRCVMSARECGAQLLSLQEVEGTGDEGDGGAGGEHGGGRGSHCSDGRQRCPPCQGLPLKLQGEAYPQTAPWLR